MEALQRKQRQYQILHPSQLLPLLQFLHLRLFVLLGKPDLSLLHLGKPNAKGSFILLVIPSNIDFSNTYITPYVLSQLYFWNTLMPDLEVQEQHASLLQWLSQF